MSFKRLLLGAALALGLASGTAQAGQTFDAIKARGTLICGVNVGVAGFSLPDSQGTWRGMDADLCRGLAAAMFGDPAKVRAALKPDYSLGSHHAPLGIAFSSPAMGGQFADGVFVGQDHRALTFSSN